MENKIIINKNCWVAYCDILGFKDRIEEFEGQVGTGYLNVFVENYFKKIIDELERQHQYDPNKVFSTWFSDSFLFFTRDDSEDSFSSINISFRNFCQSIISKKWPIRAAIGFGQLYADVSKNLFLGSAIINAYKYVEKKKQNWIGSIITPEANNRLNELGIDLSHWKNEFTEYPVPFHQKEVKKLFVSNIHHNHPEVTRAVKLMQKEAMKNKDYQAKHKRKYENTLKFFDGQVNSTYFLCSLWQKIKKKIK